MRHSRQATPACSIERCPIRSTLSADRVSLNVGMPSLWSGALDRRVAGRHFALSTGSGCVSEASGLADGAGSMGGTGEVGVVD